MSVIVLSFIHQTVLTAKTFVNDLFQTDQFPHDLINRITNASKMAIYDCLFCFVCRKVEFTKME